MPRSKVFQADNSDPEMQRAYRTARDTFRYFWREVAWDRRRIIPALDLACVKAPFSDDKPGAPVEHMWLSDVDFDGRVIHGELVNSPNRVRSVRQGDSVEVPLKEISDWMYAIGGEVFGAFTVNLMRSRMGARERRDHDAAWGLKFGDPADVRITPESKEGGKNPADPGEHPMSQTMAESLREQLAKDPSLLTATDDRGWALLHQEALAGSAPTVKVLLAAGADPDAVTDQGMTPAELARSLGWDAVAALLEGRRRK